MAFRSLSIEHPAEVHVKSGQLLVSQEGGEVSIPVSGLYLIVFQGPDIRISTMAQTMLAESEVMLLYIGKNYHPAAMTIPLVSNARQARVARMQVGVSRQGQDVLWQAIVKRKIENQAQVLSLCNLPDSDVLDSYAKDIAPGCAAAADGAERNCGAAVVGSPLSPTKKKARAFALAFKNHGSPGRIRTYNPPVNSRMLCR